MMTGRVITTLGALALGFATTAAVPALAQNAPSGTTQPSPPVAAPPAAPSQPSTSTATTNTAPSSHKAATSTQAHPTHRMAERTMHHPMRTHGGTGMGEANPNAQNAAVDQLNAQSLQAAQQGKSFTPPGSKM